MNLDTYLKQAERRLEHADVGTARLDALVLLEDITGKDRGWLLAHPEFELTKPQIEKLDKLIERRAGHEPLAYIRGKTEFYGRDFIITPAVLEPRPESEPMIDLLKSLQNSPLLENIPLIADIGTGSGALAISAKLELPAASVVATDIDKSCLDIAKTNAVKLGADVKFYQGDLLAAMPSKLLRACYLLLANLPYVPDNFQINPAAGAEPRLAIFGGKDGLDVYRRLFEQAKALPSKPKFILTESMPPQHPGLKAVAQASKYQLTQTEDFIQVFTPAK